MWQDRQANSYALVDRLTDEFMFYVNLIGVTRYVHELCGEYRGTYDSIITLTGARHSLRLVRIHTACIHAIWMITTYVGKVKVNVYNYT